MSSFIKATCSDAVLEISIDRPEKKNAGLAIGVGTTALLK
jgi:hypothetical protein